MIFLSLIFLHLNLIHYLFFSFLQTSLLFASLSSSIWFASSLLSMQYFTSYNPWSSINFAFYFFRQELVRTDGVYRIRAPTKIGDNFDTPDVSYVSTFVKAVSNNFTDLIWYQFSLIYYSTCRTLVAFKLTMIDIIPSVFSYFYLYIIIWSQHDPCHISQWSSETL